MTSVLKGEGNGTPLQYSCLENSMDRGAWQATVHGVAESRTRLSDFTFTFTLAEIFPVAQMAKKNEKNKITSLRYIFNYVIPQEVVGEGNGSPLQYSCLENPMDGGAWQATVHGVAKSRTRLSDFTFTFFWIKRDY